MRRIEEPASADETLLHALLERGRPFDASSIAGDIEMGDAGLRSALGVVEPVLVKTGWRRGRLSQRTLARLRKWFDRVEDRALAGMVLTRDRLGWCRVEREAGSEPTPPRRTAS